MRMNPSVYAFDACLRVVLGTIMAGYNGVMVHGGSGGAGEMLIFFQVCPEPARRLSAGFSMAGKVLNDEKQ